MRIFQPAIALLALAAAPATAQTAPAQPSAEPQVKMVKKTVCQRVEADRETGSRLGSVTKVCKTVEVPADQEPGKTSQNAQSANTL